MKYHNTEIAFTEEHMAHIATQALHLLKENLDEDEFEDFIIDNEISDEQLAFFEIDIENDFDDIAAWEDDSDRGCNDCPLEECTGHCMSCYYRPV